MAHNLFVFVIGFTTAIVASRLRWRRAPVPANRDAEAGAYPLDF
jgi:hypothetical protein